MQPALSKSRGETAWGMSKPMSDAEHCKYGILLNCSAMYKRFFLQLCVAWHISLLTKVSLKMSLVRVLLPTAINMCFTSLARKVCGMLERAELLSKIPVLTEYVSFFSARLWACVIFLINLNEKLNLLHCFVKIVTPLSYLLSHGLPILVCGLCLGMRCTQIKFSYFFTVTGTKSIALCYAQEVACSWERPQTCSPWTRTRLRSMPGRRKHQKSPLQKSPNHCSHVNLTR